MIDRRLDRVAQRIDTAARMKPAVDRHIMQQLDECDTQTTNETGISAKGTFNDPVMNAVLRRGWVTDASNAIDAAVVALEAAEAQLSAALRAVKVPRHTAEREGRCYWKGCENLIDHSRDDQGRAHVDGEGLCMQHKIESQALEREREEAETQRRIDAEIRRRQRRAS